MRVISLRRLSEFWQTYKDAERPLRSWYKTAKQADWANIQDVHKTFPQADAVELKCGLCVTVFNIGGNKYRLIARVIYEYRRVYIKRVLTHSDYNRTHWKVQLCRE